MHVSMLQVIGTHSPNLLKIFLRVSDKGTSPQLPGITYTKERFGKGLIEKHNLADSKTAIIYICGPPPMCTALSDAMKELNVDRSKYYFV